jgi:hypothetical protein
MAWTPEQRIQMARDIAMALNAESRGVIAAGRTGELSALILDALTMPEPMLNANAAKFKEWF